MAGQRNETGAVAVETVLVLPILALLVFGVLDFGRAYWVKIQLGGAAREGASYAQFFPAAVSCAAPDSINAKALAEEPSVPGASHVTVVVTNLGTGLTITGCNSAKVAPGTTLRVQVQADVKFITPFVLISGGDGVTVSGYEDVKVQG
jgi:Flp pilus assembly protein TadG